MNDRHGVARVRALLLVLGLTLGLTLAPPPALTLAAPPPASLSDSERSDLERIERYLNGLRTMQARILQVSSNGGFAEGELYLARPGRMRLDYDPPVPILIVADGRWLIYHDKELQQVSYLPLSSTPASILTRGDIRFLGGDLVVTGFESEAGTLRITVVQSEDPQAGSVTLVFDANPVNLRKWTVLDAQGIETQVTLVTARFDLPLNPDLFRFEDPKFRKQYPD